MSTNNLTPATRRTYALLRIVFGLVVLVTAWLLFRDKLPGNMATGMLAGGVLVLVIIAVALWRSTRNHSGITAFERTVLSSGDERDRTVQNKAFAVMGVVSVPLMSVAAIALALGAEVPMVVAIMLWLQILVGLGSFVAINKRT